MKQPYILIFLSVDESERKCGLGTELQIIREDIGRYLGATTSCLFVTKNTWMHEWYNRRGYKNWKNYKGDKTTIWLRKTLK